MAITPEDKKCRLEAKNEMSRAFNEVRGGLRAIKERLTELDASMHVISNYIRDLYDPEQAHTVLKGIAGQMQHIAEMMLPGYGFVPALHKMMLAVDKAWARERHIAREAQKMERMEDPGFTMKCADCGHTFSVSSEEFGWAEEDINCPKCQSFNVSPVSSETAELSEEVIKEDLERQKDESPIQKFSKEAGE